MMQHILLSFLIATFITLTGSTPANTQIDPLHTLTNITSTNELPLTGWEVTLKETIHTTNFERIVNNNRNSHFVSRTEDENSIKFNFVSAEKPAQITVEKRMVITKDNPRQIELIAVLKGDTWNESVQKEYDQARENLLNKLFYKNIKSFTCIEVVEGDTIESRAIIELFSESLQLVHREEQYDSFEMSKLKKMIYGYTPLWNDKFIVEGIPYNLQIATAEKDSGELVYMIGTPILITEY
ncbi:YwmB family TATA-box binding protein [Oceanobacillus alkalisoli]|uniref:YwmB family TATA-box binding protein n=1 Tax=Oceanobacillus alkalisoli TaxID=2925113 RepID=UPI001EE48A46|nr:YwmB family TATA-box binding protein [Oceanobacillus alkalisoli]MCG5102698.1 YwmB family TATA-box binding protein [Oceanobacillus alkalisoli]